MRHHSPCTQSCAISLTSAKVISIFYSSMKNDKSKIELSCVNGFYKLEALSVTMQLFQNYRTVFYAIPPMWYSIIIANHSGPLVLAELIIMSALSLFLVPLKVDICEVFRAAVPVANIARRGVSIRIPARPSVRSISSLQSVSWMPLSASQRIADGRALDAKRVFDFPQRLI